MATRQTVLYEYVSAREAVELLTHNSICGERGSHYPHNTIIPAQTEIWQYMGRE